MSEKILLDTDIGSDIDDAVCLAYLLAQPHCDLLGITTVSGEVEKRAKLASVLCTIAGKDIPIFPGVEKPLLVEQKQQIAQQAAILPKWKHQKQFPQHQALSFLHRTIREHPGEITLLTIGPLTNIALLFSLDPEIPRLLKQVVSMCGVYTTTIRGDGPGDSVEWNALLDPHAAAIVYNAPVTKHLLVGLDVTSGLSMKAQEVKKRFCHPLLVPVVEMAGVWFEQNADMLFHDPLAATVIFDPTICEYTKGLVEVELVSSRLQGTTLWTPHAPKSPHAVALGIKKQQFFDHYFSVFA